MRSTKSNASRFQLIWLVVCLCILASTVLSLPPTASANLPVLFAVPESDQHSLVGDPHSLVGDGQGYAAEVARTQWALAKINAEQAQQASNGGQGILVAVIDTGVNATHPFFQGRVKEGLNFVPGRPLNDASDVADGTHNAQVGHGTFIAGLILQVAPNAQILPIRVLNGDGVGTDGQVSLGITNAVLRGAKVINLSLGSLQDPVLVREAVLTAQLMNVVVVASAGNDNQQQLHYPAAYAGVAGVAATDPNDKKSSFSNYHERTLVSAPGTDIYSTFANGGWAWGNGTSFSAPLVAGQAALLRSKNRLWPAARVVRTLSDESINIDSVNPTFFGLLGKGRIDARRALTGH